MHTGEANRRGVAARGSVASLPERATHQQTRTFNQQLVLRAVYDRSAISRAEISRVTGLTRTSVSALVSSLLTDGLLEETGRGPSTGGKAPILLRVRAGGRHLIGIDLGEAEFTGAVVDLRGNILRSQTIALDGRDGEDAIQVVLALIDELIGGNGTSPILGIGVGSPGIVDPRTGTVRWGVSLGWTDLPLGQMIEARYGVPAVVANDSHAAALAELTFGLESRPTNLVVVRVGRGLGAGLIINGQPFHGDGSGAGEIGHARIAESDEKCRCGRVGCLETVASMRGMVARANAANPGITDDASLVAAVQAGDEQATAAVVRAGEVLGHAIGTLIATLNIRHILLVGALAELTNETTIELGAAHEDIVLLGASALLMTNELGLSLAR
jgi:predicted NBD/HSP70 family sugar kinase